MKRILLILSIVILAGCSPTKRLARLLERYPMEPTVDTVYRDTTIYRDTVVTKYLPGESVVNNVYVEVPGTLPDTVIWAETSLAYAAAHLESNHLGLELIQYDSVFKWKLDSALVQNIDTVIITRDVPYPIIEKAKGVKTFWRSAAIVLGVIVLIGMILLLVVRKK